MADTTTQNGNYISVTTPLGTDKFFLRGFSGEERISDLFLFNLDMLSTDSNVDFSKLLGENATVTVLLGGTEKRYINGIITRFVQAGSTDDKTIYQAELQPEIALMRLSSDCRIFQNQTAPKIIETVFKDMGCTDFKSDLKSTYESREYCVQYRETALEFVCRLMEEEGIVYYFEHAKTKHTLILSDDTVAHKNYPNMPSAGVHMAATDSLRPDEHSIDKCSVEQQVTTGGYALDDYNFENPPLKLYASHGGKKRSSTRYDYPGGFVKKARGDFLVTRRIEAEEAMGKVLYGDSFCPSFTAGNKFKLTDHVRKDVNDEWVLLSIQHRASLDAYRNSFTAFPLNVPYRSPALAHKPVIPGTQTALVVGKSGEEIWTDKYGRIKVQFHWDQEGKNDENSSCWIRVSQAWAGKKWGAFFLPRIGQEVIVSFLEGNPDNPLVTGAVYNAKQTVPYALPGNQTRSTFKTDTHKGAGFNELRFEDKKGKEEIFVHAQKDLNYVVEDNRDAEIIKGNDTLIIKKGYRKATVSKGDDTLIVKGKQTEEITKDVKLTHDANFTQDVKGNFTLTVKGNLKIKASGTVTIESGKAMTTKSGAAMTVKSGAAMTVKAGAAMTAKSATAMTLKSGTAFTAKSGTAMTMKSGTSMTNKAGMSMTNKAGMSMTNSASMTLTNKGGIKAEQKGTMSDVKGSAMASIKGAITKVG